MRSPSRKYRTLHIPVGPAALVAALLFAAAAPAMAASYILPADADLIHQADVIVRGRVVRVESVEQASGAIVTEIEVSVDRTLKGTPSSSVVVEQPGGQVGDRLEVYPGIGTFVKGEDVLLMLEDTGEADYRLDGFALGKFSVRRDASGTEFMTRDGLDEAAVLAAPGSFVQGSAAEGDRDAAGFESYIEQVVAGENPAPEYFVPGGVSMLEAAPALPSPEFAFLLDPNSRPEHWTEMATGGSITYKDNATGDAGSNCPTGCHTEVSQGVTGWNSAPGTSIDIVYGGTDASIGTKCRDDLDNEIQFNDPCNQIPNLTTACTGTLALGGFSGSSTGGGIGCTAQGGIAFGKINRALILVNNGVGSCLNSCDYRDMIAHETGHTIGADHSSDNSALMAPFIVHNRCGSLQADDIAFAQCAYEGIPSNCQKLPPFIISVNAKIVKKGKVRAVVHGRRFTKGSKVFIDDGSGYVEAPKTRWKKKKLIIGLNVGAIWPAGVPVNVKVIRKATGCESNEFTVSR